jgi:catechol-2,3-dioxygenase
MKINELKLFTSNLKDMKYFYEDILELPVIKEGNNSFTVGVGTTKLTFKGAVSGTNPYYHFAINIPKNLFKEAKSWLKIKVDLNTEEGDDEVYLSGTWNANAIYFEDPSGNIIEFIARNNLDNQVNHEFSSKDLLNVSEIGLVVDDVIPAVRKLNELGIPNWRDDSEGFTPVGDEMGLIIVVKNERRWFFSNTNAKFYPFEMDIEDLGSFSFTGTGQKVL